MTTRRNPKRSLGNLLREEAQKDPGKDTPADSLDKVAGEPEPGESLTRRSSPTRSRTRTSDGNTDQRSKGAPASTPPDAPQSSSPVTDSALLSDLRLRLDQAQQQTSTLAAEKAALEQRLSALSQTLQQEAQLKQQAQQQVAQLQAELKQAELKQADLNTVKTQLSQVATQTAALTVLPRNTNFQTLALPRAFSRPILDRPTPWEIPRRPLVISCTTPPSPSDLSDEDIGWFD